MDRPRSGVAGFLPSVIMFAVHRYLRYGLFYRDVEELLTERGFGQIADPPRRPTFTLLLIDDPALPTICHHIVVSLVGPGVHSEGDDSVEPNHSLSSARRPSSGEPTRFSWCSWHLAKPF